MDDSELKSLRDVLNWLIDKFRLERLVYLVATGLSVVMLLVIAGLLLFDKNARASAEVLVLLFGSTGLIGYSVNRLMRMFDQTLAVIASAKEKGGKVDATA